LDFLESTTYHGLEGKHLSCTHLNSFLYPILALFQCILKNLNLIDANLIPLCELLEHIGIPFLLNRNPLHHLNLCLVQRILRLFDDSIANLVQLIDLLLYRLFFGLLHAFGLLPTTFLLLLGLLATIAAVGLIIIYITIR
jgi:hypothetical protein